MNEAANLNHWLEANQRLLGAELACLRRRLANDEGGPPLEELEAAVSQARDAMPSASAIDLLQMLFDLSDFERQLLLLCCGVELEASLARACAEAQGRAVAHNATFSLALDRLPGAHWSALTPVRPLRRWRLLEVEPGPRLVDSALRVDERVLHYVAGINLVDSRLRPLLVAHAPPSLSAPSHAALADRIAAKLAEDGPGAGIMHLDGNDARGQQDVFAAVAARLGCRAFALRLEDLPATGESLELFQSLCEREVRLLPAMLMVQVEDGAQATALARFADSLQAPLFVATRELPTLQRTCTTWTIDKPAPAEQRQLWRAALGDRAGSLNGGLDGLAAQFRLSARNIAEAAAEPESADDAQTGAQLWRACRRLGRDRLDDLAERITPAAGWDDLVLPAAPQNTLRQIAAHLRQRIRVHEDWGFAGHGSRGLGISALFCGESGTGKTMAAEVLANELQLDLYRIDLSAVVSKYIGETEKNLRRVFDAAEDSGAILLFDEADALFGKRSEVKDSHDRYANIEISYLLQRMEAYRGLAVLTSNMKSAMDRAFHRRLRFIVNFPFPDSTMREAIWRRAFPAETPLDGIDYRRLGKLNLPGGNIRNIALNAAFLAADARQAVSMAHLLRAAQSESAKLERPLADTETRGWV